MSETIIIQSDDVRIQAAQVLLQMNPTKYVKEEIENELLKILQGRN